MNERAISLLEQYDIEVLRTRKGRGAFIFDTKQGCVTLKEYRGNLSKLVLQQQILQRIKEHCPVQVETLIPNKENQLYVKDNDGTCYIIKSHFEGSECNIYDGRECVEAMQLLAKMHLCMEDALKEGILTGIWEGEEGLRPFSLCKEYEKHNRELMRVRSYLKKKGQKQVFEMRLLGVMDYFVEEACSVAKRCCEGEADWISLCHGDYQYHNILHTQEGWCVINFEKLQLDNPVRDIYLFLRKVMEKNNWIIGQGRELLAAYEDIRMLNPASRQNLYYRFAYPEKFWKIVNFYFNSPKAWIPEKNLEKLEKVLLQEKEKKVFLQTLFDKA